MRLQRLVDEIRAVATAPRLLSFGRLGVWMNASMYRYIRQDRPKHMTHDSTRNTKLSCKHTLNRLSCPKADCDLSCQQLRTCQSWTQSRHCAGKNFFLRKRSSTWYWRASREIDCLHSALRNRFLHVCARLPVTIFSLLRSSLKLSLGPCVWASNLD